MGILYRDYNELVQDANQLSECTNEVIQLLHRLVNIILYLLDDSDQIQAGVDVYRNAIRILEGVLRTNEMLREVAEAYMCCSSAPNSLIEHGHYSQTTDHEENKAEGKRCCRDECSRTQESSCRSVEKRPTNNG